MIENSNENTHFEINQKEIWNAIVSYLMIFISGLLLINKSKYIDTPFVRWHVKSSMLIHLGFLITIIIFHNFSIFWGIFILWLWLNHIITIVLFTFFLGLLSLWMYRAKNGLEFKVSNSIDLYKQDKLLDIDWDGTISEKEKLTILLSFIPFIWFVQFWKFQNNKIIENSTRTNVIVSLVISLLYVFSHWNLANLLLLFYIVSITFIWINLFIRNELIQINIPKTLSPNNLYIGFIALKNYLKWYFKKDWFKLFSETYKLTLSEYITLETKTLNELKEKKELTIPKIIIYIPIINLITLFYRNTKQSIHKVNWLMITLLMITWFVLTYFQFISYKVNLLFLFPILFSAWYMLAGRLGYKTPIIYDLYRIIAYFFSIIWLGTKKINNKRKENIEVSLKVWENNSK